MNFLSLIINALNVDLNLIKLKTGLWKLSELSDVPKNGLKVLSCFSCGGGSTMGYKLAGFDVIGCVEIDPEMLKVYKANHNPKYPYLMGVQDFKKIPDDELPKEFFNLDILDGSPPCSSFSMAGAREKKWGKASKFREGQAVQNLDDLFFDFIDVAAKLKPKVVIAENVKGLIQGNAKGYVKQIFQKFKESGYSVQLFLLNAAAMGVPQKRERTFFIANRIDKKIELSFNEEVTPLEAAFNGCDRTGARNLTEQSAALWRKCEPGKSSASVHPNGSGFSQVRVNGKAPGPTLPGNWHVLWHWDEPRTFSTSEIKRIQTFPDDYNFFGQQAGYVCGMSVPPFMMQRIANQVAI